MMEDNVPGFIGYHITRDGKLYSRRIERSPYKFGKWHKLRLSKKVRVKVKHSITLFIEFKSETLWSKDYLLYYIT